MNGVYTEKKCCRPLPEIRAERERMRTRQKERENELGGYNIAEQKGVITVVFRTESEKRQFLESVGQDPDRNAVNFEEFRRLLS